MPDAAPNPSLGLALNASFLGFFAHAGFLAGLEEIGVRPGKLAGASAGSIAGALHAEFQSADRVRDILFDPDLERHFMERRAVLRAPAVVLGRRGRAGAMTGNKIARKLRELFGDRRIEEFKDPQIALAVTNLTAARSELITKGDLVDHLVASFAFPGIYSARRIGSHDYWDGGIALPSPFGHWADDDSVDTIIVHRVKAGSDDDAVTKGSLTACLHLAHVATANDLFELRRERVLAAGKTLIAINTQTPRLGIRHRPELRERCYQLGLASARSRAADLEQLIAPAT